MHFHQAEIETKGETDTDVQFLPNFQREMNDGGGGGKENGK